MKFSPSLISLCFLTYNVCVLNGLWTGKCDQIMRWWSSKPQSGIATVLDYVEYFYVDLTCLPFYFSPRIIYHIGSFFYPGVFHLHLSISTYRTKSFSQPCIYRIPPSITDSLSASPPSSSSHCVTLPPCILLLFSSCETPSKVYQSWFFVASWRHQSSLLSPHPS